MIAPSASAIFYLDRAGCGSGGGVSDGSRGELGAVYFSFSHSHLMYISRL